MRFLRWASVVGCFTLLLMAARSDAQVPKAPPRPTPLPETAKYWVVFRHASALDQKAADLERRGLDGSGQRSLYRESAKLTEAQAARLSSIAADCVARVEEKDREALALIQAARARAAADLSSTKRELPPRPPADLTRLQRERDELISAAREDLRRALGEQEFQRFQRFVDEKIAPTIRQTPIAPPSGGK